MSQGTRQSERAAAEAKAGTTDSGRMPGLGERPRICSTSGPAWEQEARKAGTVQVEVTTATWKSCLESGPVRHGSPEDGLQGFANDKVKSRSGVMEVTGGAGLQNKGYLWEG